jgi:hypothetical protein
MKLKFGIFLVIATSVAVSRAHSPFNKHFTGQNFVPQWQQQQQPERRNGSIAGGIGSNAFDVMFQWNIMDYEYPTAAARANAIAARQFIPQNVIPLGVAVSNDRIFVSTPRWNEGENCFFEFGR